MAIDTSPIRVLRALLFCVVPLGLCAACGGSGPPDPVMAVVPQTSRLFYDDNPTFQDSVRIVVRDADRFAEVWEQSTGGTVDLPVIDFEEDLVIVVSTGRMTLEDQIRVDSVGIQRERTVDGEVRDVLTTIVITTQGCGRFRTPAYPREIVQVRRFEGPVRFDERSQRVTNCDSLDPTAPAR